MVVHAIDCASTLALIHGSFIWEPVEQIGVHGKLTVASGQWLRQCYSDLKYAAQISPELHRDFQTYGWWVTVYI